MYIYVYRHVSIAALSAIAFSHVEVAKQKQLRLDGHELNQQREARSGNIKDWSDAMRVIDTLSINLILALK